MTRTEDGLLVEQCCAWLHVLDVDIGSAEAADTLLSRTQSWIERSQIVTDANQGRYDFQIV